VVRLLDGVMGNPIAHQQDSFENGLLEHPLYTHPRDWGGKVVPEILLSGDHGRIAKWRHEAAIALTRERRPDLLEKWLKSEGKEDHSKGKKPTK
jgi:tRNA (guanine37-N1)-methyltransferase